MQVCFMMQLMRKLLMVMMIIAGVRKVLYKDSKHNVNIKQAGLKLVSKRKKLRGNIKSIKKKQRSCKVILKLE